MNKTFRMVVSNFEKQNKTKPKTWIPYTSGTLFKYSIHNIVGAAGVIKQVYSSIKNRVILHNGKMA